jgi:TRAP-type mannitol/chloroaromatic compound transport system substrate-binding protein
MKVIKGEGVYLSESEYNRLEEQVINGKTYYFLHQLKKYNRLTEDDIEVILEELCSGKTRIEMCKKYNTTTYRLNKALKIRLKCKNIGKALLEMQNAK